MRSPITLKEALRSRSPLALKSLAKRHNFMVPAKTDQPINLDLSINAKETKLMSFCQDGGIKQELNPETAMQQKPPVLQTETKPKTSIGNSSSDKKPLSHLKR